MLSNLGKKRTLTLFVLMLLNVALAGYLYTYLEPEIQKTSRILQAKKNEVEEHRLELLEIRVQFDVLDKLSKKFDSIEQGGFFVSRNRETSTRVKDILNKITSISGVTIQSDKTRIMGGAYVEDEDASKSGRFILQSPITIEMEALSDVDVYKYIYLLENYFPGHLTVESFSMNRERNVNGSVLRAIANGDSPAMVTANMNLTWRTMVKKEQDNEDF